MNPQKNYIDERGNYHNVENLTLTQIHDRASEEGYRLGKAEAQRQKSDGDLISREALLKAINDNKELFESERVYLEGLILNTPAITPQLPREVRQALEVLEHIKERYILVEKSPRENPNDLYVTETRPQGEWVRKEDILRYIATQYSKHNELVPIWLSIGDLKGGQADE